MKKKEKKFRGYQRILLFILPYLIVVGIFQLIAGRLAGIDWGVVGAEKTSIQQLIVTFSTLVGTFLLLGIFMKFVDKEPLINLGFHTKNKLKEFVLGFALGFLIMTVSFGLLMILKEISFVKFHLNITELLISILVFTFVAVLEETLFRGYILKNLMNSYNKYLALFISSVLFSLVHGLNPNVDIFSLFNIFLAGIFLGISYIYTKNLWFPIAIHLSWNLFQSLFGFNVSGQDFFSIIEFKLGERNYQNGGNFGFEGSVLSIIAGIMLSLGIGAYYRRRSNLGSEKN